MCVSASNSVSVVVTSVGKRIHFLEKRTIVSKDRTKRGKGYTKPRFFSRSNRKHFLLISSSLNHPFFPLNITQPITYSSSPLHPQLTTLKKPLFFLPSLPCPSPPLPLQLPSALTAAPLSLLTDAELPSLPCPPLCPPKLPRLPRHTFPRQYPTSPTFSESSPSSQSSQTLIVFWSW